LQSGSKEPNRNKVGKVTWPQVKAIAQDKMPDLNCFTVESAMRMVAGTARSMGINVDGKPHGTNNGLNLQIITKWLSLKKEDSCCQSG